MKLTGNQVRILRELVAGHPPRGLTSRGLESLEARGLVARARGYYSVNARSCLRTGTPAGEVYRLTPAGVEALRERAQADHRAAVRKADQELTSALRTLRTVETVETMEGSCAQ